MLAVLIAAGLAASNDSTVITPSLVNFDLAKFRPRVATCTDRSQSDEIIVCAPKGMNFWIADAGRFAAKPIRAAFTGPLNAESSIHVVQHGSPIGVAPAAAVTFKWHF
jgi:hypothetical protein